MAVWITLEIFKADGDKCLNLLANIFNDILFKDKLPEERMLSSLVPILKEKGDSLNPNSCRAIKLLEHDLNVIRKFWMGVCVRW